MDPSSSALSNSDDPNQHLYSSLLPHFLNISLLPLLYIVLTVAKALIPLFLAVSYFGLTCSTNYSSRLASEEKSSI